jgi:hypothetical protein
VVRRKKNKTGIAGFRVRKKPQKIGNPGDHPGSRVAYSVKGDEREREITAIKVGWSGGGNKI